MQFLKLLEGLRTPFWDAFFSGITHLGEESFFIIIGLFVYWCVSKRTGFYLLLVSFAGTIVSQFLKMWVRMPRPFELDPTFTIVESARAQALGFSFPSGHTQNILGVCGSVAACHKNRFLRAVCAAVAVLVPFSRLYLGVHTPLDVLTAAGIALLLLLVFFRLSARAMREDRVMATLLAFMVLAGAAIALFAELYPFPADARIVGYGSTAVVCDPAAYAKNLRDGVSNAWMLFGGAIGFTVGIFLDRRFLRFEVKAVWWAQLIKYVLGLALLFGIRFGMKALLAPIGHPAANALRYCCMLIFASAVWPMTFPFFARLGAKKE